MGHALGRLDDGQGSRTGDPVPQPKPGLEPAAPVRLRLRIRGTPSYGTVACRPAAADRLLGSPPAKGPPGPGAGLPSGGRARADPAARRLPGRSLVGVACGGIRSPGWLGRPTVARLIL